MSPRERFNERREAAAERMADARDAAVERATEARDVATERLTEARDAATERMADVRDATAEKVADAKAAAAEQLAKVKPRLRGVSHEYAFFASLLFGAALILIAQGVEARIAVGDLRGQPLGPVRGQRAVLTGATGSGLRRASGCVASTTR